MDTNEIIGATLLITGLVLVLISVTLISITPN